MRDEHEGSLVTQARCRITGGMVLMMTDAPVMSIIEKSEEISTK